MPIMLLGHRHLGGGGLGNPGGDGFSSRIDRHDVTVASAEVCPHAYGRRRDEPWVNRPEERDERGPKGLGDSASFRIRFGCSPAAESPRRGASVTCTNGALFLSVGPFNIAAHDDAIDARLGPDVPRTTIRGRHLRTRPALFRRGSRRVPPMERQRLDRVRVGDR